MINGQKRKKLIKALKENRGIELVASLWNTILRVEALHHNKPVGFVDLELDIDSGGYIPTFFQLDKKYRKKGVATALLDIANSKVKVISLKDSEYDRWIDRVREDKWDRVVEIEEATQYKSEAGVPGSNLFRSSEGDVSEEDMTITDEEGELDIECDGGSLHAQFYGASDFLDYYFEDDVQEGRITREELEETFPYEGFVVLEHLEVDPDKRGEGIATSLMNVFLREAEKGADTILLNASPMGSAKVDVGYLANFYSKFGFQELYDYGSNVLMYKHFKSQAVAEPVVAKDNLRQEFTTPFEGIKIDEEYAAKWLDQGGNYAILEYAEQAWEDYKDDDDPEWDELSDEERKEFEIIYAKEWLDDRADEFYGEFSNDAEIDGKGIIGWRHITVEDVDGFLELLKEGKYLKGYEGIGAYWAWDEGRAEAHWAGKGELVILKASIPFDSINFEATIEKNLDYSCGRDEAELELKEGAPLTILEAELEDGTTVTLDYKAVAEK